ncbi:hypothetical protein AKJ09_04601 [Labilithrix luteola]|uniref:Uncharacterized protein n=1 Tax=Labilithrix luteola TaxID=1391654 RepID=A0A0K1PWP4_9BACT|nr:hypothetical protein [Labilithrix luteola]AKU97937.1 hypothetical protein AKJ09_04601 [Labilithrix luteola]
MINILVGLVVALALGACVAWLGSRRLRQHVEAPKHVLHEKLARHYPRRSNDG